MTVQTVNIDGKLFVIGPPREHDAPGHRSVPAATETEFASCMHYGEHEFDVVGWGKYGCTLNCWWRRRYWGVL